MLRASHQLYVAVVLALVAAAATVVVYLSLAGPSSEVTKTVGKGYAAARLLGIVVKKVGGKYTGYIHFYQVGAEKLEPDVLYFVSRDGSLHAVARVYEVEVPEGPGIAVARFVVVSGELKRGESYAVKAGIKNVGLVALMGTAIPVFLPQETYKVYLVHVEGVRSQYVASPEKLKEALSVLGEVHVVNSTSDLEEVVEKADRLTIIVDLHGETVPAPSWVWSGAGYWKNPPGDDYGEWIGSPPNWTEWYKRIRKAVAERGAVWVNVGGWPFYYVGNESSTSWQDDEGNTYTTGFYQVAICECASCDWDSWYGYHGYDYMLNDSFWCHTPSNRAAECYLGTRGVLFTMTELMKGLAETVKELTGLEAPEVHVHDVHNDRPCRFKKEFKPSRVYYVADVDGTTWYGAYALRLGRGWLLHVGFGATITEEERAAIVLAMLLDVTGWKG